MNNMVDAEGNPINVNDYVRILGSIDNIAKVVSIEEDDGKPYIRIFWLGLQKTSYHAWYGNELVVVEPENLI